MVHFFTFKELKLLKKDRKKGNFMGVKIVDTSLRDGHQSLLATRLSTEDILSVAQLMDKAGYYALEVWGGATFDACLRFLNEDPWERLRAIRKACPNTKLQMLFRGQNILGYRHYSDELVEKFVEKSLENGINIIRVFDALNDLRNLKSAVDAVNKYKAKYDGSCQIALSYTTSPVHTIDYYVKLAKDVQQMGADSICIKDMAGVLLPEDAFELVSRIKKEISIPLELHMHCTGGICEYTLMKAIEAGVDIIDTALSPLSGGTSQTSTESICYALRGTKYDPKLNMDYLSQACDKLTPIKDRFLKNGGLNPKVLTVNPGILKYEVPGGMLYNLIKQLTEQGAMDKYEAVLHEIPRVRKDLGYPPLVTPMSQMVGTQAVMNVITGERYKMCPKEIISYLEGQYGQAPAEINEEVRDKIFSANNLTKNDIITYRPADAIKPEFNDMKEKYKDICESDEDVLSCALFENVAVKFLEHRKKSKEQQ